MQQTYEKRGGITLGLFVMGWPSAKLTCTANNLSIKIPFKSYNFTPEQITAFEGTRFPILGSNIRIRHNVTNYPKKIIFSVAGDFHTVIQGIKDSGFTINK